MTRKLFLVIIIDVIGSFIMTFSDLCRLNPTEP